MLKSIVGDEKVWSMERELLIAHDKASLDDTFDKMLPRYGSKYWIRSERSDFLNESNIKNIEEAILLS